MSTGTLLDVGVVEHVFNVLVLVCSCHCARC